MIADISITVLDQLRRHLTRLEPKQYALPLSVFNGASIGAHTRHVLEFYGCLLNGAEMGIVDYDTRARNMAIQEDLAYALQCIELIACQLSDTRTWIGSLSLRMSFGPNESCLIPTTFLREEAYLIEHSIHHFALIRIGIQTAFPHVPVDADFGVAYSTIQFKNENKKVPQLNTTCAH
jgi:hypothetical protein